MLEVCSDWLCVSFRWGVSWTQRAYQLLLHVTHESQSARTQSGAELQDGSGNRNVFVSSHFIFRGTAASSDIRILSRILKTCTDSVVVSTTF